jgi:uncharacterized protein (UPF0216 family)
MLEGLWQSEKAKILGNLPKAKKSLTSLLSHPVIKLTNGEELTINFSELEFISKIVPVTLNDQLKLPFLFQKRKRLYFLLNGQLEKWLIEKILNLTDSSPFLLEVFSPRQSYFAYHFQRIQSKIPTLVFLTYKLDSSSLSTVLI